MSLLVSQAKPWCPCLCHSPSLCVPVCVTAQAFSLLVSQAKPFPCWCHRLSLFPVGVTGQAFSLLVSQAKPFPCWCHRPSLGVLTQDKPALAASWLYSVVKHSENSAIQKLSVISVTLSLIVCRPSCGRRAQVSWCSACPARVCLSTSPPSLTTTTPSSLPSLTKPSSCTAGTEPLLAWH